MSLEPHPTKPDTLVFRGHPAALAMARVYHEPVISDARAAEIRGELCKKYPGTWIHEYHKAIEQAVLAGMGIFVTRTDLSGQHIPTADVLVQHLPSDDTEGGAL